MSMKMIMKMFMFKFVDMDVDMDTVTYKDKDKDRDLDGDTDPLNVKNANKFRSNVAGFQTPLNNFWWVSDPSEQISAGY